MPGRSNQHALPPSHHVVPPRAVDGRIALCERELIAWGERLGRAAEVPLVVAISGELGAGKTTLAQAICRGAGVRESVTSPTFALVHQYVGIRFPVFHLDLYRLEHPRDMTNIGWDDILRARALIIVEWPERAEDRMPPDVVRIELEHDADDPSRRLLLAG